MAEVFLGRATVAQGLNKQLVIKKIHRAYAKSRHFVSMFRDEASIALELNHPNVVQVFDFGQVGDTYFLVMEHVEGLDLLRLMHEAARAGRKIPLGLCAYIVQQVAKGLDYAHRKTDEYDEPLGIVHRDISPQNVLLSWDGGVKIVDFGIARARNVHEEEGVVKGKLAYMAPEQARGEQVDRRADVYSSGVVLFEVCCGRALFPGKGKEVLDQVKAGAITRPRDCNPDIPDELEQTIVKALAFHPEDRYQTGRDLQSALAQFHFHLAQVDDQLFDSGTLAQFISQVVPSEKRRPTPRPPTALQSGQTEPGTDSEVSGAHFVPVTRPPVRERKHVFVVAGQVTGIAALEARVGEEQAKNVIDDFFKVAADIAYKEEAIVYKAEGSSVLLVVGLPAAREDDASRTIRLGKLMIEALDGIGLDVEPNVRLAVGIQRGVAILKSRKGDKLDYDLGSSTTQIASLLATEAHGAEILCGGTVYRAAKDDWHFEKLTTIDLPTSAGTSGSSAMADPGTDGGTAGGSTRANVYRLRGPKERAQRIRERSRQAINLIGRELELKALRDAFREVSVSGKKRQVIIVGEAGLGKRALLSSFLASLAPSEANVFRAVGRAATSLIPFGIIADLGRDFFGLPDGADPGEIRKRATNAIKLFFPEEHKAGKADKILEATCTVLGAGTPAGQEMDAGERLEILLNGMSELETRMPGDTPLVFIAEDVHYADSQSMALFRELIRKPSKRGVFALITSRPDDEVLETANAIGAEIIGLDELDTDDAVKLVRRRFVPDEQIDDLAKEIVSRAGGNPLFLTEMVDSLVDRKILLAEPEGSEYEGLLRWSKREAPVQIPSSIEALLVSKIDRLPQAAKHSLMHAAILGRRFEKRSLTALLARPVDTDLSELQKRGLLAEEGGKYQFKSELAMTVAYQLVPDAERTELHRTIAKEMAKSPTYQRGTDDAVIARHFELAGDNDDAADRYLAAAAHAVDVGGNTDAFRQLTRALKLIPQKDHKRRFVARRQRAEILMRLARRSAEHREIESLLREAVALDEPDKLAIAHARMARFYLDVGKLGEATRAVDPALVHAKKSGDILITAWAMGLQSQIARHEGRNDEALEIADQALSLLTANDEPTKKHRAMLLNIRGHALWAFSKLRESIEAFAEALVIYQFLGLPRQESRLYNNMGVVFATMGEHEQALANYKSALKLDQRLGDRVSLAMKLGNIGQAYSDLGDLDRGERYLRKARTVGEKNENSTTLLDIQTSLGQVFLARGKAPEALALFEQTCNQASEARNRYQEARAMIYWAFALLELDGESQAALERAERATELARKMPMPVGEYYGLAVQGLAKAALGDHDEAVRRAKQAVALLAKTELPEGTAEIQAICAELCLGAQQLEEARVHIEVAFKVLNENAARLGDEALKRSYLSSRVAERIGKLRRQIGA